MKQEKGNQSQPNETANISGLPDQMPENAMQNSDPWVIELAQRLVSAEPMSGPIYSEDIGDACLEFTITNYVGSDKEQLTFQLEFDGDAPNAESLQ